MKEVKTFLNELLNTNDVIIVGTSGGPDSMCLLSLLNAYKNTKNLKIVCAHVNHGLRLESCSEAEFVKKYCIDNDILFEYMVIDNYKNNKFSEEEGRRKRYVFFDELAKKYNANYLMTAHHGDDLIETILMRIVRGSNLKGYIGIPRIINNRAYKIVRPLLNVDKNEIYEYLTKEKINYVIDKSNENEKYTRNRYRKRMLPFLKSEDKKVHLKFLKYSEELEKYYCYINQIIKNKIKNIYNNNRILINELKKEDPFLQKKIIEYVIEDIQKEAIFNINDKQLENIINLINVNENKQINLADNFIARRSYNYLYIEKNNYIDDYKMEFINDLILFNRYKFQFINDSDDKSNYITRLNSAEIKLPLYIRNKKDGDKIKIKNLSGSKKLKDVFIDCKIDIKEREKYPLIVDSNDTIIWIPGLKKTIFDKEIEEKYDIILKYTEEKNE